MTTLEQIQIVLNGNKNVTVVGVQNELFIPSIIKSWEQTCDIYVAPKNPIFNLAQLQDFMLGLVPGIKTTSIDIFSHDGKTVHFGHLLFIEPIGTETTTSVVTFTDNTVDVPDSFQFGELKTVTVSDLNRVITVRVYPSIEIARKAYKTGENQSDISPIDLTLYEHGLP